MNYMNERNDGVPCDNSQCGFHVNKSDQQNCDAQDGSGDPGVASCSKYFPLDGKEHKFIEVSDVYLSPREICRKYQIQKCHCCEDITCGDNTSPLKSIVIYLKNGIDKIYMRLNDPCLWKGTQNIAEAIGDASNIANNLLDRKYSLETNETSKKNDSPLDISE